MQSSRAIVLHQIKYSETSLILKIYTEKEGLLSFIVKGVRGKRGRLRTAQFQPLNVVDLTYRKNKKSPLRIIQDLKITEPFKNLFFHPIKRAIAIFLVELIQNSIKEEEPNKEMFEFLYTSIYWLDLTDKIINCFHLLFMMKLTKHLGFYPRESTSGKEKFFDLQEGVFLQQKPLHPHYLDGEVLEQWEHLISCRFEEIAGLKIPINQKRILVQALMDYYKLHLNYFKELNSHQILQTVFSDE